MQEQNNQDRKGAENRSESVNENLVDRVGETNIYPVSEMKGASSDAEVHTPADLGQAGQIGETQDNE